jgi:hypothetical protein
VKVKEIEKEILAALIDTNSSERSRLYLFLSLLFVPFADIHFSAFFKKNDHGNDGRSKK